LSSAKSSPLNANIWARIAAAVLRQYEFVIEATEQDFSAMRHFELCPWLHEDTKRAWTALWKELAEARERGQVRATATAYLV
jgi:ribosome modulation factor